MFSTEKLSLSQKELTWLALVLAAVFCLFISSLRNSFVNWDDPHYVIQNPLLNDFSLHGVVELFSQRLNWQYHPLAFLTFLFERHFFGLNPLAYHLDNVLLHLVNVTLVFFLIKKLFRRSDIAACAALLFGIHPLQVEAVVWITARKDLLFTAFYLSALLSYTQALTTSLRRYEWLTVFLFLAALLSKEMAVSFPLVLLLLDYFYKGRVTVKDIFQKIPFWALSLGFGLATWLATKSAHVFPASEMYSWMGRIFFSGYAVFLYCLKTIDPSPLSCYHPLPDDYFWASIATVSLLILLLIFYRTIRQSKLLCFSVWFFILTVWPALHLLEVNDTIINERYIYLPFLGLILPIAKLLADVQPWMSARFPRRLNIRLAISFYIFLLVLLSYNRSLVWKDSRSLWQDVIATYPQAAIAYHNLGVYYSELGHEEKAIKLFTKAFYLEPQYAAAYYNTGNSWAKKGEYAAALEFYKKTLTVDPDYTGAYVNAGNMYFLNRELDAALVNYNEALSREPYQVDALLNRGMVNFVKKQYQLAWQDFSSVLQLDPGNQLAADKVRWLRNKGLTNP